MEVNMKKVSFFVILLFMSIFINTNSTFAQDIKYKEVKVIADNTGYSDVTAVIQRYLTEARYNATDSLRYKIIIPKGVYKLTKNLNIFSNTWLYLEEGAVMTRCFSKGAMLKNGVAGTEYEGYDSFKNIRLEGGTWDGLCFDETYGYDNCTSFSTIRFGHASNIEIENVEVITVPRGADSVDFKIVNYCLAEYGQGKLFEKSFPWNPSKTFKKYVLVRGSCQSHRHPERG